MAVASPTSMRFKIWLCVQKNAVPSTIIGQITARFSHLAFAKLPMSQYAMVCIPSRLLAK